MNISERYSATVAAALLLAIDRWDCDATLLDTADQPRLAAQFRQQITDAREVLALLD